MSCREFATITHNSILTFILVVSVLFGWEGTELIIVCFILVFESFSLFLLRQTIQWKENPFSSIMLVNGMTVHYIRLISAQCDASKNKRYIWEIILMSNLLILQIYFLNSYVNITMGILYGWLNRKKSRLNFKKNNWKQVTDENFFIIYFIVNWIIL